MATTPTPEQGKPILDFSAGTFDGSSNLIQSRNGATEHVNGDDVADYVNTSRIYNTLETESKTPVGAINEVNRKGIGDIDDVNLSSPADGEVLTYDSSSSKWVNRDLSRCIRGLDVNIGGTQINTADSGWYYAEVPFTLPTGAIQLGMYVYNYDASIIPVLGNGKITLRCPTEKTVPGAGRVVRVIYFLP